MREVDSPHPAGTVGVIVGELARYSGVFKSIERLKVPRGTKLLYAEGVEVARNHNTLVDEMSGEWLWIMGDDHRFGPDILMNLLERQVDIVVPLVLRRQPPFETVIFKKMVGDGLPNEKYRLADLPTEGLLRVDAAGSAGMLVRHRVFGALPKPWFEFQRHTSEDVGFCVNARAEGFKVYADLDQTMTHITTCEIEPVRKDGRWTTEVSVCGHRETLRAERAEKPALRVVA